MSPDGGPQRPGPGGHRIQERILVSDVVVGKHRRNAERGSNGACGRPSPAGPRPGRGSGTCTGAGVNSGDARSCRALPGGHGWCRTT